MKRTKLGIGLLLMLALVVTSGTFAYWASTFTGDTAVNPNVTVTIGTGGTESSTLTLTAFSSNTGSALVPTSQGTPGTDDTATWTIPMDWDQDTGSEFAGAVGDLTIQSYTLSNGTSLTDAELKALFTVSIPATTLTEGAASQDVVVSLVFANEPADLTEYNLVQSSTLTISITFEVTPQ